MTNKMDAAQKEIATQFGVSLLWRTPESVVMWATREGASGVFEGISTVGLWHFVEVRDHPGGSRVRQWHIPRFILASELHRLNQARKQFGAAAVLPIVNQVDTGLSLVMVSPKRVELAVGPGPVYMLPMPAPVKKLLRDDLETLERAQAEVREAGPGDYELPDAETNNGGSVRSSSEDLIAAVAFEWLTTGALFATDFGVYSAHCTSSQFTASEPMDERLVWDLSSEGLRHDAAEGRPWVRGWYEEIERRLFRMPIWSRFTQVSAEERNAVLAEAMASLTRTQQVQLVLMNGMLQADVMMPLAVLTGVIGFDQYIATRCEGLQPHDLREQDVRKVIAFIKLYGQLAGVDPLPAGFTVKKSMFSGPHIIRLGSGMKRPIDAAGRRRQGTAKD